jgi:hypothetical protein
LHTPAQERSHNPAVEASGRVIAGFRSKESIMAQKKKKSRAKPAKKRRVVAKRLKSNSVARKTAKPARGKKAVKKPAPKRGKAKTRKAKPVARKNVLGEGNYTASRNFRKSETAFVQRNKKRIPGLGQAAEAALDGPEGKDLLAAEEEARGHSHLSAPES